MQEGQSNVQDHLPKGNKVIFFVVIEANIVDNKTDKLLDTGALRNFHDNKVLVYEFVRSPWMENIFIWVSPDN